MYSVENLLRIKNVLHRKGAGWAYENVTCDKPFLLNWSTKKKGSASTAKVGDIIALFQTPKMINGRRNRIVHFTHLVSPVSTDIFEDTNAPDHKWCREVQLIAKADPIEAIPNPGYFNFFLPNRGLTNPIINLTNYKGLSEAETQTHVWKLFEPFMCRNIAGQLFAPQNPEGIHGEIEGDIEIREHIRLELRKRNSRMVQQKKSDACRLSNGRLLCECCDFDFFKLYGVHGLGFIECHHKVHISEGERITRLEDLALVCSNCHRMLHRRKPSNDYYSIEELRELILANIANSRISA